MAKTLPTNEPTWSYLDVMTTATALIASDRLHAEDELWVEAWSEIITRAGTRDLLPELARAPVAAADAVRDEVEELRRVLLRAGFAGIENPTYDYITLRPAAKAGIKELHKDLIDSHGTELTLMATILDERLAVKDVALSE